MSVPCFRQPATLQTGGEAINDNGTATGVYLDSSFKSHVFLNNALTTFAEPAGISFWQVVGFDAAGDFAVQASTVNAGQEPDLFDDVWPFRCFDFGAAGLFR